MIIVCLVLWIVYAIIEGKREAMFWHHRIKSSDYITFKDFDRHPLFSLQRGVMLLVLVLASYQILDNIYLTGYLFIMNGLVFSFFHNGAMYLERYNMSMISHPIDSTKWIYKKGWWAQSTTSTAWSTKLMTPISRTIQAIIGILGYLSIPLFTGI